MHEKALTGLHITFSQYEGREIATKGFMSSVLHAAEPLSSGGCSIGTVTTTEVPGYSGRS
jgi:hypothetical protein